MSAAVKSKLERDVEVVYHNLGILKTCIDNMKCIENKYSATISVAEVEEAFKRIESLKGG